MPLQPATASSLDALGAALAALAHQLQAAGGAIRAALRAATTPSRGGCSAEPVSEADGASSFPQAQAALLLAALRGGGEGGEGCGVAARALWEWQPGAAAACLGVVQEVLEEQARVVARVLQLELSLAKRLAALAFV